MTRYAIYLLFLSLCSGFGAYAYQSLTQQMDYKLIVNLDKAPFESLVLLDYTSDSTTFEGKKTGEFTWEIMIPDSTVQHFENMVLMTPCLDSLYHSPKVIRFHTKRDDADIMIVNIGVEDRVNYIRGTYVGHTIIPDERQICEDFELNLQDDDADIAVRAQAPWFSWFLSAGNEELSYEDYLTSYIQLSKRFPDSRYLISSLAQCLYNYKSKDDIEKIYENFSDKHRQTLWANRIERYLYGEFQNISLPTLDQTVYEEIIQDSSRYNLITFTASWCGPCIEEIPLLKKVYSDLNDRIGMTYVAIDEEKDVPAIQKIIRNHAIPWRTLLAYPLLDKVKEQYSASVIPKSILVYPDGKMENIDLRYEEQRQKLYTELRSEDRL